MDKCLHLEISNSSNSLFKAEKTNTQTIENPELIWESLPFPDFSNPLCSSNVSMEAADGPFINGSIFLLLPRKRAVRGRQVDKSAPFGGVVCPHQRCFPGQEIQRSGISVPSNNGPHEDGAGRASRPCPAPSSQRSRPLFPAPPRVPLIPSGAQALNSWRLLQKETENGDRDGIVRH